MANKIDSGDFHNLLKQCKSEEDVKALYIQYLGLKKVSRNLVDIQTEEIWFEAKATKTPIAVMFTQLLFYVNQALKLGESIPPFLSVIDGESAAIMDTKNIMPLFDDKNIKWGRRATDYVTETVEQISTYLGTHYITYKMETHAEEYKQCIQNAIKNGTIIRVEITPANLKIVFDKWVEAIGVEIDGARESDYATLFYADIMQDGYNAVYDGMSAVVLRAGDKPIFCINGKNHHLLSRKGYDEFWRIYHRPPKDEYRSYLLERRDSLIASDVRSFKGAYYTPLHLVEKAYEYLDKCLGKNWQKTYIVWDMCCGVGNLETKHSNHRQLFMSTLDQEDIDIMKASKTCVSAVKFQYDYLNDDITDDGKIDYSITNKLPAELRDIIKEGKKKLLVLMNPPYAEAGSTLGKDGKSGASSTMVGNHLMGELGKAKNELFVQFLARIQTELPTATIAMFSKLKYINAPNFAIFREQWQAKYLGGFIAHSKAFDGLNGNFPIGFLVWDTSKKKKGEKIDVVKTDILDKNAVFQGEKNFYNLDPKTYLNVWLKRPKANDTQAVPLKSAVDIYDKKVMLDKWSDGAIGYMWAKASDMQNANQTAIFSSVWGDGHGTYLTADNLALNMVVFAVRRLIKPTWINDRDQFLQPSSELPKEFVDDCLVWSLFSGSNLSSSADGLEYAGKQWSIVNHFIPFTEEEVGANGRFESEFMVNFIAKKKFSPEAKAVLETGKKMWQLYFKTDFEKKIRDEYKLGRADVGWYQIRMALKKLYGDKYPLLLAFNEAYDNLTTKLRPQVFELGFLRG